MKQDLKNLRRLKLLIYFDAMFRDWGYKIIYRTKTIVEARGYASRYAAKRGAYRLLETFHKTEDFIEETES